MRASILEADNREADKEEHDCRCTEQGGNDVFCIHTERVISEASASFLYHTGMREIMQGNQWNSPARVGLAGELEMSLKP